MGATHTDENLVIREAVETTTDTVLLARPAAVAMEAVPMDVNQSTLQAAEVETSTAVVARPVAPEETTTAATPTANKPAVATDARQQVTSRMEVVVGLVDMAPKTTMTRTRAMGALLVAVDTVAAAVSRCLADLGMTTTMTMRDADVVAMVTS